MIAMRASLLKDLVALISHADADIDASEYIVNLFDFSDIFE